MKIWLFITDGDDGFNVELRATEDGARARAWAWLRDVWTDYGIKHRMPSDLAVALEVAGKEADQHGRVEEREVDLVLRSPLVSWLRQHFPAPGPFNSEESGGYSVSGALAFYGRPVPRGGRVGVPHRGGARAPGGG